MKYIKLISNEEEVIELLSFLEFYINKDTFKYIDFRENEVLISPIGEDEIINFKLNDDNNIIVYYSDNMKNYLDELLKNFNRNKEI